MVYLDIRKDWVDVNVHPQKWEVRCLRQEALFGWLRAAIRKGIAQATTVREVSLPPRETAAPVVTVEPTPVELELPEPEPVPPSPPRPTVVAPAPAPRPVAFSAPPRLKYLGQAKAAYLVCEDAQGIVIVDQHALHEKMRFEELRARHREGLGVQRLLVPLVLTGLKGFDPILEEHRDLLAGLGFEMEAFGNGDVAVKTRPELLTEARVEGTVRDILESLRAGEGGSTDVMERALHRILATLACHSVVRAGQQLSPLEAQKLLGGLSDLAEGWTCPHGRPVLFRLGFGAIEKHFERS